MDISWFEDLPITLFIDTSALKKVAFDFSHPLFKTIKDGASDGSLKLVVTDISKGEFLCHCKERIQKIKSQIKNNSVFTPFSESEQKALIEKIESIDENSIYKWFCSEFSTVDISSPVDWRSVFADYFGEIPPFSEKKRKEFPDAFNLKMLEKSNFNNLAIVSSDGDFKKWCLNKENAAHFENLSDFSKEFIKHKQFSSNFPGISEDALGIAMPQIISELTARYSDDSSYQVTCYHSTIDSANIIKLDLTEQDLIAIDLSESLATYQVKFYGEAELELNCPVYVWDSIDKETIFHGSNSKSTVVEVEILTTINLYVNVDNLPDSKYEIYDEEFFCEDFEVPHEWTSFIDDPAD